MKLIYKLGLCLLILLLGITCIYQFNALTGYRDGFRRLNQKNKALNTAFSSNVYYSGTLRISPSLKVRSFENDTLITMQCLLKNMSQKLVLRVSEKFCDVCLNSEFNKLKLLAKKIGESNIYLAVSNNEYSQIKKMKEFRELPFKILCFEGTNLFEDISDSEFNHPYIFIINNDGVARSFFIADAAYPDFSDLYYNSIKIIFKKKA